MPGKAANHPNFSHGRRAFQAKINNAFTDYSRVKRYPTRNRKGHPKRTGTGAMHFWAHITQMAFALREFVAPTYRPERHYMRGPGPACARRGGETMTARVRFH